MDIEKLSDNVFYIKNAVPLSKEFLKEIESNDNNEKLHGVIPPWQDWVDGTTTTKIIKEDGEEEWHQVYNYETGYRGLKKNFNWDVGFHDERSIYPRKNIPSSIDEAHELAAPIVEKIDAPVQEILSLCPKEFGINFSPEWITKNYTLKKYKKGSSLGSHIDKNVDNPTNTMDWTLLLYLNDEYEGGNLVFTDLNISLKPEAGSALLFSCTEPHMAEKVLRGEKAFIFLFIHSEYGVCSAEQEDHRSFIEQVKNNRNSATHLL